MKVLVVGNLFPPFIFGGYEILCSQFVDLLQKRGYEITVLTSDYGLDFSEPLNEKNVIRKLKLTTNFPNPGENVGFVDFRLSSIEKVAKINFEHTKNVLNSKKFDLVFCWCLNRMSLGPVHAAQEAKIPVVYTINDEHPKQFKIASASGSIKQKLRYLLEKWVYPKATFRNLEKFPVTIISQALKNILLGHGVPISHAKVIYQGIPIDAMRFSTFPSKQNEPFKILYVGQLSKAKGVHTIINALGNLKETRPEKDISLTITGSGVPEYLDHLKELISKMNLSDKVTFTGQVPHTEISKLHHSHHAFVFSSEWEEPFGLAHLEAMAYGNPVISTTTGGSKELIKHNVNALEFEAGNKVDLSIKIEQLFSNEEERIALALRAREYVNKNHSFTGYVDQLETFMKSAINSGAQIES
jgi:glycosyltransferase involved in cell wall biosynthesis